MIFVARWPLFTDGLFSEVTYTAFVDGKILEWSL